jgi:hypothetical protein
MPYAPKWEQQEREIQDNKRNRGRKKRTMLKGKEILPYAVGLKWVCATYCTRVREQRDRSSHS